MNPYLIARKIVQDVILIVLMAVVIFVVYRLMPGNPAQLLLFGAKKAGLSSQKLLAVESQLGLAGGKWNFANFLIYMRDMFTFNFGFDYFEQLSVWDIIKQALPYTMLLFGTAAVVSFVIGIPLGIVTTWVRGTKKESTLVSTSNILNAIPFFVLAIVLIIYLTAKFPVFPVRADFPIAWISEPGHWGGVLYYMFLPTASLVIIEAAGHLLTTRAAMVGTLGEDFITTAKAKGVSEGSIMFHHAARNAMIPISTRMALEFALLMSGAVIVEIIFSWPGMGHLLYQATLSLDYPLAEGALFVISLVTIITYSFVDFIHAWLDPRIKL
ncbi:MAG: ABC transporter permease [Candidatus Thermoplasmatota archaeon]|jgi:peptide/nickel transport system permease protein|nr:ABC transporter permease [Candidatus Thermoplasmatota archaeon]WMT43747.1 MAG: ABC transporter permease [Cuniculiplasma divulgatum]